VSRNPVEVYLDAKELGVDTVLTSGGADSCLGGKTVIGQLLQLRDELNGPEVLIGAGVKASVIRQFRQEFPGARAFHMSGKTELESGMVFRKEGVPMGLPGFDEWHIQQTGEDAVRDARNTMDE
jgi:copper homeostasis protein